MWKRFTYGWFKVTRHQLVLSRNMFLSLSAARVLSDIRNLICCLKIFGFNLKPSISKVSFFSRLTSVKCWNSGLSRNSSTCYQSKYKKVNYYLANIQQFWSYQLLNQCIDLFSFLKRILSSRRFHATWWESGLGVSLGIKTLTGFEFRVKGFLSVVNPRTLKDPRTLKVAFKIILGTSALRWLQLLSNTKKSGWIQSRAVMCALFPPFREGKISERIS